MSSSRLPSNSYPLDSQELSTTRQHRRGAWSLSLAIHVATLTVIGWLWATRPEAGPPTSVRSGGIVLAESNSKEETEYYDEQEFNQQSRGDSGEQQSESDTEPSKELAPPSTPSSVLLNEIQLPGEEATRVSPTNVVIGDPLKESKISSRLPGDPLSEQFLKEERARLQARQPVGPVGKVSLFGSEAAEGRSFVFVIDRSKSMGGKGLNALVGAHRQLQSALAGLQETHRFQIVVYHHKRVYFHPTTMVRVSSGNVSRVNEFFGSLLAVGGTDHHLAVLSGLRFKPDVLFLLNDGGHPAMSAGQLAQIRRRAGSRTTIHTIQFGLGPMREETSFMQRLAEQNGGHFQYVNLRQ